jgi:hypothetical protein
MKVTEADMKVEGAQNESQREEMERLCSFAGADSIEYKQVRTGHSVDRMIFADVYRLVKGDKVLFIEIKGDGSTYFVDTSTLWSRSLDI